MALSIAVVSDPKLQKIVFATGDSDYQTGGYAFRPEVYMSNYNRVSVESYGGYSGEYDPNTHKLLFSKGGREVGLHADMSGVTLMVHLWHYASMTTPVNNAPTVPLQTSASIDINPVGTLTVTNDTSLGTGGGAGDKVDIKADTATITDGTTLVQADGSKVEMAGERIDTAYAITSPTENVTGRTYYTVTSAIPEIPNFVGGVDDKRIAVYSVDGGTVIKNNANISIDSGDYTMKAGDSITFRYDTSSGKWKVIGIFAAKGDTIVATGGNVTAQTGSATQISGAIVQPTATVITTDNQNVSGSNLLSVTGASPSTLTGMLNTGIANGTRMTISFSTAATIQHQSGGGNIQLAGGIDFTAVAGATTVLVYNSATGYWVEDASQRYVPT